MKTLTFKNTHTGNRGFASILTVLSVGIFLLLILTSLYMITIESQQTVKNNTLRGDYQQREEAFLRAMVANTAQFAIRCMQDGSDATAIRTTLRWDNIMNRSLAASNASVAITDTTLIGLGFQPNNMTNGHTADASAGILNALTITDPTVASNRYTTSSIGNTASVSYPAPLTTTNGALNGGRGKNLPIISHQVFYGPSATGWVGANVAAYPQYNIVPSPESRFNYNNSNTLIAKHNWWSFAVDFSRQDAAATNLTNTAKNYIISIYEIPSQLALSANASAALGTFGDAAATAWGGGINIAGPVFAEDLTTTGNLATSALTSRKGITMGANTGINGTAITGATAGANPMASNQRELAESSQTTFPIYASSDGGKVAFIPINRDISFYDRFSGKANIAAANAVTQVGINTVSGSSWEYYINGAHQCAMHLDITAIEDPTTTPVVQEAKTLQFSYLVGGNPTIVQFSTDDGTWPSPTSPAGLNFPFHSTLSPTGSPQISLHLNRLAPYIASIGGDAPAINHSLSINADYTDSATTGIQNPSDNYNTANAIFLESAENLSLYTGGFSLVTNMRLITEESINTTPALAIPTGYPLAPGEIFYPPVSIFAPEKRYGSTAAATLIQVNGQVGSIEAQDGVATNPLDFKSGTGAVPVLNTNTVTANLTSITHPGALPPINLINWMIVIRPL